ncbi:MAG: gamma-glutamyl-gamma-aminobutyrate hydrolase family protein [Ilumatobacteraceae bacterium]
MTKPRIAMTTWRRVMPTFLSHRTDLYTLGAEYPQAVLDAGGLPLLLPHHKPEDARQVLEGFDGLVLVGGDDIHPNRYGQEDRGLSKGVRESADESDLAFAAAAVEIGLPLFGICRGYQALNVAMGGTLHQDSTDDDGLHRPISDSPEEVMGERHPIEVLPDSHLAKAYGTHERIVNSIHHQAVETVAPGYRAVAWAPDGTIEAIEAEDSAAPILAVQWHPEKIAHEGDDVLFHYFIDELVRGR